MIKACIFDLDGTMTNSLNSIAYFVNMATKKYGMPEIPVEEFKMMLGNGVKKLIERVLKKHNKEDSELEAKILKEFIESYQENPLYLCEVYDGILALLEELKAKNIKLAVLSNKEQTATEHVIKSLFPKDAFICVCGAKDGVPLKPDPTAVYAILSELQVEKDECLFIGDSSVDIQTGKNAGLSTVGVLWGFRSREELESVGADHIISHASELLKFI